MKIITLLENTARRPGLAAARGLSVYAETAAHRILFDMGPDGTFLENARALGVDLSAVDIGKVFDNRDHSTVLYSIQQVEKKMKKDPSFAETVKEIKTNINSKQ